LTIDHIPSFTTHRSVLFALQAVPFLLLVSAGGVLIFKSDAQSQWAFPGPGNASVSAEPSELQAVALSVAGAVVIALAIPDLARIGWNFVFLRVMRDPVEVQTLWLFEGAASRYAKETWGYLVGTIVQLLLGLGLFLRSRVIVRWWGRLNRAGANDRST
jgi:hypothetical protein